MNFCSDASNDPDNKRISSWRRSVDGLDAHRRKTRIITGNRGLGDGKKARIVTFPAVQKLVLEKLERGAFEQDQHLK